MDKKAISKMVLVLLLAASMCRGVGCCGAANDNQSPQEAQTKAVEEALSQLNQATRALQSYQCQIEYLFSQPLFESRTLRNGTLYYQKYGESSKLRINFKTVRHDDEKQQKYRDEYIFNGKELTHIDYQLKEVKLHQLADTNEPNEPVEVFDLVSEQFPIIGFGRTDELKKNFYVRYIAGDQNEPSQFIKLLLTPKSNSSYKDNYTSIDFWIDKKSHLPAKIITASTEDDIYEISLIKPKINKGINKRVFDFKIPKGFGSPEIVPLKKTEKK